MVYVGCCTTNSVALLRRPKCIIVVSAIVLKHCVLFFPPFLTVCRIFSRFAKLRPEDSLMWWKSKFDFAFLTSELINHPIVCYRLRVKCVPLVFSSRVIRPVLLSDARHRRYRVRYPTGQNRKSQRVPVQWSVQPGLTVDHSNQCFSTVSSYFRFDVRVERRSDESGSCHEMETKTHSPPTWPCVVCGVDSSDVPETYPAAMLLQASGASVLDFLANFSLLDSDGAPSSAWSPVVDNRFICRPCLDVVVSCDQWNTALQDGLGILRRKIAGRGTVAVEPRLSVAPGHVEAPIKEEPFVVRKNDQATDLVMGLRYLPGATSKAQTASSYSNLRNYLKAALIGIGTALSNLELLVLCEFLVILFDWTFNFFPRTYFFLNPRIKPISDYSTRIWWKKYVLGNCSKVSIKDSHKKVTQGKPPNLCGLYLNWSGLQKITKLEVQIRGLRRRCSLKRVFATHVSDVTHVKHRS